MRRVGNPNRKVTLLDAYDADHDNHIVHTVDVHFIICIIVKKEW